MGMMKRLYTELEGTTPGSVAEHALAAVGTGTAPPQLVDASMVWLGTAEPGTALEALALYLRDRAGVLEMVRTDDEGRGYFDLAPYPALSAAAFAALHPTAGVVFERRESECGSGWCWVVTKVFVDPEVDGDPGVSGGV